LAYRSRRRGDRMIRREFLTLLGGAAAWPMAARAQQPMAQAQQPGVPVVGLLSGIDPDDRQLAAVRQGLNEAGFVAGKSVAIEHRRGGGSVGGVGGVGVCWGAARGEGVRYLLGPFVGPLG